MLIVTQQGILDAATSPVEDADVIMTAAIVGHAYIRLDAKKNCLFDIEIDPETLSTSPNPVPRSADEAAAVAKMAFNWAQHVRCVAKINAALASRGGNFGRPEKGKEAMVGVTPVCDKDAGIVRVIGGTGDLSPMSKDRYTVVSPKATLPGALLLWIAQQPDVGYQGRGAYTGFVQVDDGSSQPGLFCTCRQRAASPSMPVDKTNPRRWMPSMVKSPPVDPQAPNASLKPKWDLGATIGSGGDERYWGMIQDNAMQSTLAELGMYFRDDDKLRAQQPLALTDIVGYTHGMIQAIYNVRWLKKGTPYEIVVGKKTTKLASCFTCAIFMEANGFPASATHLGRGESWCPLYAASIESNTTQDVSLRECNAKWANYCKSIIDAGIECIASRLTDAGHRVSYQRLIDYVAAHQDAFDYANLILDAVTVHDSEVNRIDRTLSP